MRMRFLAGLPSVAALSLVAAVLLAGAVPAAAEAGQFDRHGRRLPPGAVPLVFGPPSGAPWRGAVGFGMAFPVGVDAVVISRGLGSAFRMVLPRVGPAGSFLDAVVDNVEREDVSAMAGGVAGVGRAGSVVYTGTLRRRPDVVVVLSVVNGVLYSRFAVGEEAWVIYSDAMGRVMVRVERRSAAAGAEAGPGAWPAVPGVPQ
ncbi:MAG: hypothetical protein F4137_12255 [Acidobacteria bacterium]|nr:hypothetical protein [Acidobacteriota bacterium]